MNQIETEIQSSQSEKIDTTDTNFANLRKKLDIKDQKLAEKEQLLKQAQEEAMLYKQQLEKNANPQDQSQPNDPLRLKDTDYVDVNIWNSLVDRLDKVDKKSNENALAVSKTVLSKKYDDFDKVFNKDNLKKLAMEKPELVLVVENSNSTPYQKMAALYYGITGKPMANQENYQDFEKRAREIDGEMNQLKKVQSIPTGKSKTPFPNVKGRRLSPELEDQLFAEMNEFMPSHLQ